MTDKQYIKGYLTPIKYFPMHNLSTNFHVFLEITKSVFKATIKGDNNFKFYPRKPKQSDCEVLALALTAESLGIDSESCLFGKLRNDYPAEFPDLIHRSNYNRRKKVLGSYLRQLNQVLAGQMNEGENVFIVDSVPIPICKVAREK